MKEKLTFRQWCQRKLGSRMRQMAAIAIPGVVASVLLPGLSAVAVPCIVATAAKAVHWAASAPPPGGTDAVAEAVASHALGADDSVSTRGPGFAVATNEHTGAVVEAVRAKRKLVRDWVVRARLHFGEVKNTPADQLCVKRWLGEQMKAADVRDTDARATIPAIAFLATVPDEGDVFGAAVQDAFVVRGMQALAKVGGA